MDVLYLCNRMMCGEGCSYPICKHTTNEKYALNPIEERFYEVEMKDNGEIYLKEIDRAK